LQNLIGDLFERAYNRWQAALPSPLAGYTPNPDNDPNTFKAWSPLRQKFVIPDGFMHSVEKTKNGVYYGLAASYRAHWSECKASNKEFISLGDYEKQIGGAIDALKNLHPWACQEEIAAISYVTTIDMIPSRSLVSTANAAGIWIFNSYPYFKIVNDKMTLTFCPPFPYGTQFGQTFNIPTMPTIKAALSNIFVDLE
jgi:hypothetical protein